jgi:MSHA biogenesis protein MshJ
MAALESMPTQLFWGRAQLEAETWPASRLTLHLHTLSLDAKWMKL